MALGSELYAQCRVRPTVNADRQAFVNAFPAPRPNVIDATVRSTPATRTDCSTISVKQTFTNRLFKIYATASPSLISI